MTPVDMAENGFRLAGGCRVELLTPVEARAARIPVASARLASVSVQHER